MRVFKAPEKYDLNSYIRVFLAGSIEMGTAENWQSFVEESLSDYSDEMLTILNPRRDDFDATQQQSINNSYFKEQVDWELDALEDSNYIFMYFHPETKAPITLLELGLHADSGKLVVVCPPDFYRRGNVEIVADRYNFNIFNSLEEGISVLRSLIDYDINALHFEERLNDII